jgi:hypothetical protein
MVAELANFAAELPALQRRRFPSKGSGYIPRKSYLLQSSPIRQQSALSSTGYTTESNLPVAGNVQETLPPPPNRNWLVCEKTITVGLVIFVGVASSPSLYYIILPSMRYPSESASGLGEDYSDNPRR